MDGTHVSEAAARTGWSPRMLRYLERVGLVVPSRTAAGYRRYGLRELNQLRSLVDLRRRYGVALDELAFAMRLRREPLPERQERGERLVEFDVLAPHSPEGIADLRREPELRGAVDAWLAGADDIAWVEWEQRKHERLLAA